MEQDNCKCLACSEPMKRIRRHFLMRLLPGSRFYRCENCCKQYLRFIAWFRIK